MNYTSPGDQGKSFANAGGYAINLPQDRDIAEIFIDNIYKEDWSYHSVIQEIINFIVDWITYSRICCF